MPRTREEREIKPFLENIPAFSGYSINFCFKPQRTVAAALCGGAKVPMVAQIVTAVSEGYLKLGEAYEAMAQV